MVVYHGTSRADRIGNTFRADRATSGPMAYFIDDTSIAGKYSIDKADTSISRDAYDYRDQFTVEVKEGRGKPKPVNISNYWYNLTQEQRDKIAKIAPTIGRDDNYEIASIPNNEIGTGGYELHIREARGNHLEALVREWLDSGDLFNKEREFLKILKLVGLDNVQYVDPNAKYPGVFPVVLDIRKPFITTEISDTDLSALRKAAERAQKNYNPHDAYNSDAWDKTNIEPMEWLEKLEKDIANNTTFAWTQIPDWVTRTLKKLGYDGIKDTGGKYHDTTHNVFIPFKSTQVKSAIANNGEYNSKKSTIYNQPLITREDVDTIQSIPGKSINDFTSDEIDKTEKWAGKFWHELKTKSPYFRAWFGDWRANEKTPIKIVQVTGTKEDIQKGTYKNNDTGWDILVSRKIVGETTMHSKRGNQIFIDALGNIDEVIKNAVLLDSKTRQAPKSEIQAVNKSEMVFMHDLYAIIEDKDGNRFLVDLMVDELYNEDERDTFRRAYELRGITKTPLAANRYTSENGVHTYARPNGAKLTVADLFNIVKENDTNFKPKESSKVVDENGEPLNLYRGSPEKMGGIFEYGKKFYGGNKGFWFTTSESAARDYAFNSITGEYGEIKNIYLNAHNILDLTPLKLHCTSKQFCDFVRDNFGIDLGRGSNKRFTTNELYEKHQDKLYSLGNYDAIKLCDVGITYIAKRREQIKSAIDNQGTFNKDNPNIYSQAMPADTPEFNAKEQLDEVRREYESTDQWLRAPNGKKSNLNEKQWLQVRTPNFKKWFGDWENYPENSSKIVDENGEPRVVYHGTGYKFSTFDIKHLGAATGNVGFFGRGFYFAFNKGEARIYSPNKRVLHTFLNLRNPFYFREELGTYDGCDLFPIGANDAVYVMNWVKKFPELSDKHFVTVMDKDTHKAREISLKDFVRQLENVMQTKKFLITEGYDKWLGEKVYYLWFDETSRISFVRKTKAENKLIQAYSYLKEHVYDDIDIPHISLIVQETKFNETITKLGYDGVIQSKDGDEIVAFIPNQVKSATRNSGVFSRNDDNIYNQTLSPRKFYEDYLTNRNLENIPISSTEAVKHSPISFEHKEIEQRYNGEKNDIQNVNVLIRIMRSNLKLLKSFRNPLSKLSSKKDLLPAKAMLEQLGRKRGLQVHFAMKTFTDNLKGLNGRQLDLFGRKRLLDDLIWRKQQLPSAELPFGFDEATLKKEHQRFTAFVEADPAVKRAIQLEERTIANIAREFAGLAKQLGLNLDNTFKNPHYYRHQILEYADTAKMGTRTRTQTETLQDIVDKELNSIKNRSFLKHYKGSDKDINTNYIQANAEVRQQMLMDIETMKTLLEIKKKYDMAPRLRNRIKTALKQGDAMTLSSLIPEGYTIFNPAGSRLIQSANSVTENVIAMALDDASDNTGIPLDEILNAIGVTDEESYNQLWVVPTEIKDTLKEMARGRDRGILGNTARIITKGWKFWTLFNPLRNLKYNFRNFTGDLDAVIAGNPNALRYFGRSVRELTDFYRNGEATDDLIDFIEYSGGLRIQSMQINSIRSAELEGLDEEINSKGLRSLPAKSWRAIRRFFDNEVAFTEWRENLLRYAAYLAYKEDMDNNNGVPSTLGASNEEEIMALSDIKERAYKMSNELLGDYENISEFGKILRELAMPFWSWQEVNAKRYYRIIRNGIQGYNASDFMVNILLAQTSKIPFYALTAADAFAKIALFEILVQLFNRLVHGDADDELPEEVKNKPHITFGKVGGRIYYFDRIGALGDLGEWINLDNIVTDAKQFANGQQTLGNYMKQVVKAPFNKAMNTLNPFIKMPFEIATGKTLYPDAFNAGNIRDTGKYLASTLGLTWPYKATIGQPRNDLDELTNVLLYSVDADEAAYWQTLNKVRQFQRRVLGKHYEGFATTPRGEILRNLKTALRYKDRAAIQRYLKEYKQLDGTDKGLKTSMRAMDPLHGLSKEEQKQFMRWISEEDRKYLQKAQRYYREMAGKYLN